MLCGIGAFLQVRVLECSIGLDTSIGIGASLVCTVCIYLVWTKTADGLNERVNSFIRWRLWKSINVSLEHKAVHKIKSPDQPESREWPISMSERWNSQQVGFLHVWFSEAAFHHASEIIQVMLCQISLPNGFSLSLQLTTAEEPTPTTTQYWSAASSTIQSSIQCWITLLSTHLVGVFEWGCYSHRHATIFSQSCNYLRVNLTEEHDQALFK